jgi:hypothetical protein
MDDSSRRNFNVSSRMPPKRAIAWRSAIREAGIDGCATE